MKTNSRQNIYGPRLWACIVGSIAMSPMLANGWLVHLVLDGTLVFCAGAFQDVMCQQLR